MNKKGYRYLPHTADIKVEAIGETLDEAFENAGKAFTDIVVNISNISRTIRKEIRVEGEDLEELLYNFIEELILKLEIENLIFSFFNIKIDHKEDKYIMRCLCEGEEINPKKHGYKTHVKAITYHDMEIREEDNRLVIRYVVDI